MQATLPLPPRWCPAPSRGGRPTASIKSVRWRGAACAACMWARSRSSLWRCLARYCWRCAGQPAGAAVADAGRRVREVAAGPASAESRLPERMNWVNDPVICHDDAAAGRCAGGGGQSMVKVDAARSICKPFWTTSPPGVLVLDGRPDHPLPARRHPHSARHHGGVRRPLSNWPGLADFAATVGRAFLAFW